MSVDLRGRSLLSLREETPEQIRELVRSAGSLKRARAAGSEQRVLTGRSIALIFEKTSTRTRSAFEVAAAHLGAHPTYLGPGTSQIAHKESIKDSARVLGRMYDAIAYRGSEQAVVEELAEHAGVPVYNALTDDWHPTQMLADVLTMVEHVDRAPEQISYAYVGDARNNTGHSLLLVGAKLGMDVRIGAPAALQPDEDVVRQCRQIAAETGARLSITDDPVAAVQSVDVVHTDVWVSMGEPVQAWGERLATLLPYQVNTELLRATGNPGVRFMHCLPAFHDEGTVVARELVAQHPHLAGGVEVTDEVFESAASIVFEQAENRLHTIKALLVASLA